RPRLPLARLHRPRRLDRRPPPPALVARRPHRHRQPAPALPIPPQQSPRRTLAHPPQPHHRRAPRLPTRRSTLRTRTQQTLDQPRPPHRRHLVNERAAAPRRAYQSPSGGENSLIVNTAPCGSRTTASLVHIVSEVDSIAAPSRSAAAADSSRFATVTLTCQCGVSPGPITTSAPITSANPAGAEACRSWMVGSTVAARWSPYPGTCSIVPAPWSRSAARQPNSGA